MSTTLIGGVYSVQVTGLCAASLLGMVATVAPTGAQDAFVWGVPITVAATFLVSVVKYIGDRKTAKETAIQRNLDRERDERRYQQDRSDRIEAARVRDRIMATTQHTAELVKTGNKLTEDGNRLTAEGLVAANHVNEKFDIIAAERGLPPVSKSA